jgi:hypothetical protein
MVAEDAVSDDVVFAFYSSVSTMTGTRDQSSINDEILLPLCGHFKTPLYSFTTAVTMPSFCAPNRRKTAPLLLVLLETQSVKYQTL